MDMPTLAVLTALAGTAPLPVAAPRAVTPRAAAAPNVYVAAPSAGAVARAAFYDALMSARVIGVGEKHDEPAHHLVQAEAVAEIADRDANTVVGLEMVSQDQQADLDAFMAGSTSEAAFAAWWSKAWGYDYAMYKPIFDAARARRLRVVGLNAPIKLVAAVAKKGLAGLAPAERARLPATIAGSSDARYRDFVKASLEGHKLPPEALARMIEAQAVWNETMGAKVAELAAGARVVVIAGQGHMLWGAGVPESAARRGAGAAKVVLPYPLDGGTVPISDQLARLRDPRSGDLALADGFVLVP
jgi:uncharacterized iron-regulated protein